MRIRFRNGVRIAIWRRNLADLSLRFRPHRIGQPRFRFLKKIFPKKKNGRRSDRGSERQSKTRPVFWKKQKGGYVSSKNWKSARSNDRVTKKHKARVAFFNERR